MPDTVQNDKALEHLLARELQALESRPQQDRDAQFRDALECLLADYGISPREAMEILLPGQVPSKPEHHTKLKVFRNPYTKETVRTYGYNHATLNEWRRRHGRITVQTWQVR